MLFRARVLADQYKARKERLDSEVRLLSPDSLDPDLLDGMMRRHRDMGNAIYAGPLLSVSSFCVNYPFTFRTAEPALEAVKKYQVPMAYGCLWHDDGGECCDWLGLLGMQYYAESAYRQGPVGREVLDARFAACTGS